MRQNKIKKRILESCSKTEKYDHLLTSMSLTHMYVEPMSLGLILVELLCLMVIKSIISSPSHKCADLELEIHSHEAMLLWLEVKMF